MSPGQRWWVAPSILAAGTTRCTRSTPPPATSAGATPPEIRSAPARRWRAAPSIWQLGPRYALTCHRPAGATPPETTTPARRRGGTGIGSSDSCTRSTPPPGTSDGPTPPEATSLQPSGGGRHRLFWQLGPRCSARRRHRTPLELYHRRRCLLQFGGGGQHIYTAILGVCAGRYHRHLRWAYTTAAKSSIRRWRASSYR